MTVSRLLKSCAIPPASRPMRFHLLRLPELASSSFRAVTSRAIP